MEPHKSASVSVIVFTRKKVTFKAWNKGPNLEHFKKINKTQLYVIHFDIYIPSKECDEKIWKQPKVRVIHPDELKSSEDIVLLMCYKGKQIES